MSKPKPSLQVRVPSAPKNLEDFVSGQPSAADTQAPSPPPLTVVEDEPVAPPTSRKPAKVRGTVKRSGGGEVARLTVYLPVDVAVVLKRHCFEEGIEQSTFAAEAVERAVKRLTAKG